MLQPFVVAYMTGPGVFLCLGEGIVLIEGSQDICPQDFNWNDFELFFIMLRGRDLPLDILNVTLIFTLPAIPHVARLFYHVTNLRDLRSVPYSHRMVQIFFDF